MSIMTDRRLVHLGLDVHKDSISAGILRGDAETADVERISSDEHAVRQFIDLTWRVSVPAAAGKRVAECVGEAGGLV
jgi:hypothetical protein